MAHYAKKYSLLLTGQFLFLGVQLPFLPGWMAEVGFTERDIGLLMGVSLVLRVLLGPFLAWWAERQHDQRRMLWAVAGLLAVCASLLLIAQPLWAYSLWIILMLFSFGCLVPLSDSALLRADKADHVNYGQVRGFGSFAFIIANLLGGVVITRYGDGATVVWMALAGWATILAIFLLPQSVQQAQGDRVAQRLEPPRLADVQVLIASPSFLLMLLASGLVQGAHATYYYFSELHWSALGYRSDLIGILWTVGVLAEIGLLLIGRRLCARFGAVRLIAMGAVAAAIRWPLTGLSPPLWGLVMLQLLHAFTFATTYLGSVEFIRRAVPENLINTSMTLVSTIGIGAITGIAAMAAGFVFQPDAPFAAYAMMGGMGLAALAASVALGQRWTGGVIRSARDDQRDRPRLHI